MRTEKPTAEGKKAAGNHRMQKERIMKRLGQGILACILAVMVIAAGFAGQTTADAANARNVKRVSVRIGSRNVTKKTHALERGKKCTLTVTASPKRAVKSVSYKSQKTDVASVSQKGRVTAKKAGTTKITITVTGRDNKKKSTWVKVRVTNGSSSGNNNNTNSSQSKILVAYFSATNNTERIAGFIADSLNADRYEITPEVPYTSADLNNGNDNSRTSIEMNDPSARPAISGSVRNMEQYDVIFLGYPIWWGEAPRIINTFLESYDFSGKTIVPFCTSGSSGIGSSATNLRSMAPGATWLSGRRFSGSASRDSVVSWVNGLGL